MTLEELATKLPLPMEWLAPWFDEFVEEHGLPPESDAVFRDWLQRRRQTTADQTTVRDSSNDATPTPPAAPFPTETYTRHGLLGQGSVGEIHVVKERDLGRTVAWKQLRPSICSDADVARFQREARITAQLEHPSIVPVYRLEQMGEAQCAYTMKLIEGVTMAEYLSGVRRRVESKEPLPARDERASRIRQVIKVAEAVSYAHNQGFIHRDLKPSNIMLGPFGEVYVMDWGLARSQHATDPVIPLSETAEASDPLISSGSNSAQLTMVGAVLGTPAYMAPEQARGEQDAVGPWSDQYTLGLILQEVVTLQKAVPGTRADAVIQGAMLGYRVQPEALPGRPPIARELHAIIERCLALEPGDRYPDIQALIDDLQRYLDGQEVLTSPDRTVQRVARWFSHHRDTTLLLLVGLLWIVFMSSTLFLHRQHALRDAASAREAVLTRLLTMVSSQGQQIDRQFLRYEGLTMSLAAAATQSLTHGGVDPEPTYTGTAFENVDTAPPDLAWSARYQREVSIDWPVFQLAPGVDSVTVQPLLDRLSPLRHTFRLAMLRSQGEAAVTLPDDEIHRLLSEWGVPLVWAYVGLEEGVHVGYPGKGGYPDDFDPRQRPWYQRTLGITGPHWGDPYADAMGQGLLLPCTMAIFDEQHEFRGVAGVELTLETIIEELMELPVSSGLEETWLLDAHGRVLVHAGDGQEAPEEVNGALVLPLFGDDVIRREIQGRGSGYLDHEGELVVYNRLGAVGWYYVATGPTEALLGAH